VDKIIQFWKKNQTSFNTVGRFKEANLGEIV